MKYAKRMFAIVVTMMTDLASAKSGGSQKLVANAPFQFGAVEPLIRLRRLRQKSNS